MERPGGDPDGIASMELAVDGIRCAGCMQAIEGGLAREPAILGARVNLALKRVSVEWREALLASGAIEAAFGVAASQAQANGETFISQS